MTILRTSRVLAAPPEAVFAAIRNPTRLARWWGPAGFTNTFRLFEFRPGGQWQYLMHGPGGQTYANASEFVEIVPNALVRIRHVSPPQFVLSLQLSPEKGGTLLQWEQAFDDAKVGEGLRAIAEPANEQNLDRLAAVLKGEPHPALEALHGTCACGSVGWRFQGMPESATACSCTACRRYGSLWAYGYEGEGVHVSGETRAYVRGTALGFHFCPTCGCMAYWRGLETNAEGRRRIAVNLRLTEPEAVAHLPIDHFDGYDEWQDLPRDGRCIRDHWF